jgi:hypothetical protein
MIPDTFHDYFLGSMGAAAALIGLLFVAISIGPERVFGPHAPPTQRLVAESAFSSLIVAFFVSTAALIPDINIGYVVAATSLAAILSTASQAVRMRRHRQRLGRAAVLALAALATYGFGAFIGVRIIRTPRDTGSVSAVSYLLLVTYGIALARSWELLGARDAGLFSSVLGRTADTDDDPS